MSRLFIEKALSVGDCVFLSQDQRHYLKDVLRCIPGDNVLLSDENGSEFTARVDTAPGEGFVLKVEARLPARAEPSPALHLFAGLLKGNKMERIVRDAAELGVASLTPVVTSRTIPRDMGAMKHDRMVKVASEESRRAGRNRPLMINAAVPFSEAISRGTGCSLILWENETRGIREVLRGMASVPADVAVFSGPEGGFSPGEVTAAQAAGVVSVGLGRTILRAETAPAAAVVIIRYEWGEP